MKLTPYKVVATGIKEGFLQFIDALPVSTILANGEYRTIKEYLRKNNPSETDKYGITAEAMDNYVRSCGNCKFRYHMQEGLHLNFMVSLYFWFY